MKENYYHNVRNDLLELLPKGVTFGNVLDVGCAAGKTGEALKRSGLARRVIGLEQNPEVAELASRVLDEVVVASAESSRLPFENEAFDLIIFADVLEHLVDPWKILSKFTAFLKPGGRVLVSLPNIQNWKIILRLMSGRWWYTDHGILDRTHLRFFTYRTAVEMLKGAGLSIEDTRKTKGPEMKIINLVSFGLLDNILSYHLYFLAKKS